jgi:hypothetical protein
VSNGTLLLQGIDGRSASARRFRDLIRSYLEDFDVVSEADETLIRTAAMLTLGLEGMTAAMVRGERAEGDDVVRMAGQLALPPGAPRCLSTPAVSYR